MALKLFLLTTILYFFAGARAGKVFFFSALNFSVDPIDCFWNRQEYDARGMGFAVEDKTNCLSVNLVRQV